jgi:hypothetical protein
VAIITKTFTAYYTDSGLPLTGLSPTITIRQLDLLDPANIVVNADAMIERGSGFYTYDFASYDTAKNYGFVADGGVALSQFNRYVAGTNIAPDALAVQESILNALLSDFLQPETIGESLSLIRGLVQHNFQLENAVYSPGGVMTDAIIKIWDTAANVGTPTGLLATYQVSATEGAPGQTALHRVVRL